MPVTQEVHIDRAMTEFSLRYSNSLFIAESVIPPAFVQKDSDKWFKYDKSNMRSESDGPRGDREAAEEASYSVTTDSYQLGYYSLKDIVTDRVRNNSDAPLRPDEDAVQNLLDKMLLGKEIRAAALMFSTSNITQNTTLSGTSRWSDYSGSDPFGDIETARAQVLSGSTRLPNAVVMGWQVWSKLKYHTGLVERIKYSTPNGMTLAMFADLIEIEVGNIFIGAAQKDTAVEGQTYSASFVWGKGFNLFYRNPNPSPSSLACALTLRKQQDREVTTWRSNDPAGDYKKVEMPYVQKLVEEKAAYYIASAVA